MHFPRSVAHCLAELTASSDQLPLNSGVRGSIEKVSSHLSALSLREIARERLHESMDELQQQLGIVHDAIGRTWFSPTEVH